MKNFEIQFLAGAFLFVIILISGYWMKRQGAPYKPLLMNIHKFISLGSIALIGMAMIQFYKIADNTTTILVIALPTLLFALGALISGGIMAHKNTGEGLVSTLHQLTTIGLMMTLITMVMLYLPL